MDWFKGKFAGKAQNRWFPLDVPLHQSIESLVTRAPMVDLGCGDAALAAELALRGWAKD